MFFAVFIPIVFGVLGLLLGSFANVIIYRGSNDIPLLEKARSFCPSCGHELKWYDNIPLFSYLLLQGKCRYCKKPISIRYPLVELTGLIIFLGSYFLYAYAYDGPFGYHYLNEPLAILDSLIASFALLFFFAGAYIDRKTQTIPTYLLIILSLLFVARFIGVMAIDYRYWPLHLIGFGLAVILFLGSYLLTTFVLKKEALGLADVILALALGLGYDCFSFLAFLIVSTVLASILEIIKLRKQSKAPFAFLPYLFAGYLFIVWGFPLIRDFLIGGLGL